jgi:hypothetical protein
VQRLAGPAIPQDGCFALIGDTYGNEVGEADATSGDHFARDLGLSGEDFKRVVFDPSRLRIDLSKFTLGNARNAALFVEEYGARTGCALVESENVAHATL